MSDGSYSRIADQQLDALEEGDDADLYNAALDACELVLRYPRIAQARSSAITTTEGIRFRLPVIGHEPVKVFWSLDAEVGPRVEAVFPHP